MSRIEKCLHWDSIYWKNSGEKSKFFERGDRTLNGRKGRCPGAGISELLSSAHKRQCRLGMMAVGGGGGSCQGNRGAPGIAVNISPDVQNPTCLLRSKAFLDTDL